MMNDKNFYIFRDSENTFYKVQFVGGVEDSLIIAVNDVVFVIYPKWKYYQHYSSEVLSIIYDVEPARPEKITYVYEYLLEILNKYPPLYLGEKAGEYTTEINFAIDNMYIHARKSYQSGDIGRSKYEIIKTRLVQGGYIEVPRVEIPHLQLKICENLIFTFTQTETLLSIPIVKVCKEGYYYNKVLILDESYYPEANEQHDRLSLFLHAIVI